MSKLGYFIYLLLVIAASAFFIKLAVETFRDGEDASQQRDKNMEQRMERELAP